MKDKETDSDCLPREVEEGPLCQNIDDDGFFCRKEAVVETYVFGNSEQRNSRWYRIFLCKDHSHFTDLQIIKYGGDSGN